ncbi:MAG: hypothetical protein ACLFQB_07395 [Chitinispirillaceae bacterium]
MMQGIQGTTSWAQFMKLTQQARARNSGLSVPHAAKPRATQPEKKVADVYTRSQSSIQQVKTQASRPTEAPRKTVGFNFDAYA